jgi:asparagine synthase (glutamine-hydrolysing)
VCGIAGKFIFGDQRDPLTSLNAMLDKLHHRGPDSRGVWQNKQLFLGHTRLAIHDLSIDGHQPMISHCNNYALVFNGEIYNYQKLKQALSVNNISFKGESDTEVLLASLQHWGIDKTLKEIDGMFAFAFWSASDNKLIIARDRMGEKPLYWFIDESEFSFSSELKSLKAGLETALELSVDAVDLFLKFSYIPAPYSIYKNVSKLLPGHYISLDFSASPVTPVANQYYSITDVTSDITSPIGLNEKLEDILIESIDERLSADVPLGAFLSGGIDSSLVCALAKTALNKDISTFTIGFNEKDYDESIYATDVAKHLQCQNHVEIVTQQDMLDLVPKMASIYSEPFADSSQLPTYLLCEKTRNSVTVALSGDGGDELFGGYSRYQRVLSRWSNIEKIPHFLRSSTGKVSSLLEAPLNNMNSYIHNKEKVRRSLRYSSAQDIKQFYCDSISYDWQNNVEITSLPMGKLSPQNDLRFLMKMDSLQYLPDDILVKVDRASMAHSLEVRVPLLANKVLDYSARLHSSLLVKNGAAKWPLREILYKYVPKNLIERPKKGFAVPIKTWLKEALRPWAESLLDNIDLQDPLVNVNHEKYHRYWHQHINGQYDWSSQLWNYLQLLSWIDTVHKR